MRSTGRSLGRKLPQSASQREPALFRSDEVPDQLESRSSKLRYLSIFIDISIILHSKHICELVGILKDPDAHVCTIPAG